MGFIYKITNQINNKVYIGQTITPIKQRMYKHYSNAKKAKTGIDFAINKYGKENFLVEEICKCKNEELDDLEKFYIQKYNSYYNGYNLTMGGQDTTTSLQLNKNEVIEKYLELKNVKQTADFFHCCEKTISNLLHQNNIEIKRYNVENLNTRINCKKIKIIELDKDFDSITDCGIWLIEHGYSNASSKEIAYKGVSRVLRGERKSQCGLHFEYL